MLMMMMVVTNGLIPHIIYCLPSSHHPSIPSYQYLSCMYLRKGSTRSASRHRCLRRLLWTCGTTMGDSCFYMVTTAVQWIYTRDASTMTPVIVAPGTAWLGSTTREEKLLCARRFTRMDCITAPRTPSYQVSSTTPIASSLLYHSYSIKSPLPLL